MMLTSVVACSDWNKVTVNVWMSFSCQLPPFESTSYIQKPTPETNQKKKLDEMGHLHLLLDEMGMGINRL